MCLQKIELLVLVNTVEIKIAASQNQAVKLNSSLKQEAKLSLG